MQLLVESYEKQSDSPLWNAVVGALHPISLDCEALLAQALHHIFEVAVASSGEVIGGRHVHIFEYEELCFDRVQRLQDRTESLIRR